MSMRTTRPSPPLHPAIESSTAWQLLAGSTLPEDDRLVTSPYPRPSDTSVLSALAGPAPARSAPCGITSDGEFVVSAPSTRARLVQGSEPNGFDERDRTSSECRFRDQAGGVVEGERRAIGCFIVGLAGILGTLGTASASWSAAGRTSAASTPTTYVTNSQSDTVTVVSGTAIAGSVRVGNGPVGIALTPDRTMAYVADYGFLNKPSHTVTPVILGTGKVGRRITVGAGPMAIAVDSQVAVVTLEGTAARPGHQVVVIDLASRRSRLPSR